MSGFSRSFFYIFPGTPVRFQGYGTRLKLKTVKTPVMEPEFLVHKDVITALTSGQGTLHEIFCSARNRRFVYRQTMQMQGRMSLQLHHFSASGEALWRMYLK
jgi:hypothetical protein